MLEFMWHKIRFDCRYTRFVPIFMGMVFLLALAQASAQRVVLPLDGTWEIEESIRPDEKPEQYLHTVVVPGLVNQAKPSFPDVDNYESDIIIRRRSMANTRTANMGRGRTKQKRNYFWYKQTFTVPAQRQRAVLVVNKAQFGTEVWLNEQKVGEHFSSATAGIFDVTEAIDWIGENLLVIRIGAHPNALPDTINPGADKGKVHWAPGIYDSVVLWLADSPTIETVQVAPRIDTSEVLVQTRIKNKGPAREVQLVQFVKTKKGSKPAGQPVVQRFSFAENEERVVEQTLQVPDAVLWSPDNPFLYILETSTNGDSCSTRFGMREFRFDPVTNRAMLNNKVTFLRGASLELHRFFGDPKCGDLPWNEAWIRKLLVDVPRSMHWNSFRVNLGAVPQQWLDIADEAGVLLQLEYPIWAGKDSYEHWNKEELITEFREFLRDNWNHPSVVIWDTCNETHWDFLGEELIPAVRGLDLSNRPWENGYNLAQGPDDPYEDHPYLFLKNPTNFHEPMEQMNEAEVGVRERQHTGGLNQPDHASIINEYDGFWLRRDGSPTLQAQSLFLDKMLGGQPTAEQRVALRGYLVGGLTEYWRAYRQYAGVLFYTYLGLDDPLAFTCDFFSDVQKVKLEPHFVDFMGEAFKPLGVYIRFWQPSLPAGKLRTYDIMLVNDTDESAQGKLELLWEFEGEIAAQNESSYHIPAMGQATYKLDLATPQPIGQYQLKARAIWDGKPWSPTVSRRKVSVGMDAPKQ